jgi:hypothetical protein
MATEKKNYKPKVDPDIGQEVHLCLLKDQPYIGENKNGKYFLYSVVDLGNGKEEKSFFAPDYIHELIQSNKLARGSEFKLKKIAENGNGNQTTRLELALIAASANGNGQHVPEAGDNLKEIMEHCVRDAVEIINSFKDQVPFQTADTRSIASTLFIARSKQFA